ASRFLLFTSSLLAVTNGGGPRPSIRFPYALPPLAGIQHRSLPQHDHPDDPVGTRLFPPATQESLVRAEVLGGLLPLAAQGARGRKGRNLGNRKPSRRPLHHRPETSVILGHDSLPALDSRCSLHLETGAHVDPALRLEIG